MLLIETERSVLGSQQSIFYARTYYDAASSLILINGQFYEGSCYMFRVLTKTHMVLLYL